MCHARKERVLLVGTDQRITSGPAATAAAFRGRIHGCTRIVSRKVRFFSLAPRAPSIHGTFRPFSCAISLVSLPLQSRLSPEVFVRSATCQKATSAAQQARDAT